MTLHLVTIWAKHEDDHGIYGPQFVAAFPLGLADGMPELFIEWSEAARQQYRDAVDSPVVAFFEGNHSIERPAEDWSDGLTQVWPDPDDEESAVADAQ
jgi:hypothetical protein